MNDLTPTQPPKLSVAYSATAEMTVELAKALSLVAPISMSVEQQELWLRAAADALEDIRPTEVTAISAELRRTVTRPSQIVPEIARLVADRRKRPANSDPTPQSHEFYIDREAQRRRGIAQSQAEVEDAWSWERNARIEAGLHVPRIEPPLTRAELDNLAPALVALGLKCGALVKRDGQLEDRNA